MPYTDENSYKEIGFISGLSVKEFAYNMPLRNDYRVMTLPGVDKDNYADFLVFVDGVLFNKDTELKFGENEIMIDVRYIGENSRVVVFNRRTDESFYSYQKEINKNASGLEKTFYRSSDVGDFYLIVITKNNEIQLHDRFVLNSKAILSDDVVDGVGSFKIRRSLSSFDIYYAHTPHLISARFYNNNTITILNVNGRVATADDPNTQTLDKVISEKDLGGKFFYIDDIYHAQDHGGNYINVMKLFDDTHTIKRLTFDAELLPNNTSTI